MICGVPRSCRLAVGKALTTPALSPSPPPPPDPIASSSAADLSPLAPAPRSQLPAHQAGVAPPLLTGAVVFGVEEESSSLVSLLEGDVDGLGYISGVGVRQVMSLKLDEYSVME